MSTSYIGAIETADDFASRLPASNLQGAMGGEMVKKQYGGFNIFTSKEHEEKYRAELRDKLRNGLELSEFDRIYLSEKLTPKTPKQNRPSHRPKGSLKTVGRNRQLCVEYLNILTPGDLTQHL